MIRAGSGKVDDPTFFYAFFGKQGGAIHFGSATGFYEY